MEVKKYIYKKTGHLSKTGKKENTEPGIILLIMAPRVFYIVNDKMIEGC